MAIVIKPFSGCQDGEHIPVRFHVGDTVEGELAKVALREGWATEKKSQTPPKNKAHGASPANKSASSPPARVSKKKTSKRSKKKVSKR